MSNLSKKTISIRKKIKSDAIYKAEEAILLLQEFGSKKFIEGVDIAVNLGLDPRKSDQALRRSTKLPKGTGKVVRVAVFAQGDNAAKA